jgi:MSHA biogenesis protein MshP
MKTLRGFSLPTAIFLLVILALLGAFMVSLSTTQNVMSAQDVQGSRAYNAARAGMEWALYNLKLPATTCPASPTSLTVDGFTVSVTCSLATHDEGGTTRYIFYIASTASTGGAIGTVGRVERMVGSFVEF